MGAVQALFYSQPFSNVIQAAPNKLIHDINRLSEAELLNVDNDGPLIDRLVEIHLVSIPRLRVEETVPTKTKRDIDGNSTEIRFRVPFTGDSVAFDYRPSEYLVSPLYAEVESQAIAFSVTHKGKGSDAFQRDFDSFIGQVKEHLDRLQADMAGLGHRLRDTAKRQLAARREKINNDRAILEGLSFKSASR